MLAVIVILVSRGQTPGRARLQKIVTMDLPNMQPSGVSPSSVLPRGSKFYSSIDL